MAGQELVPFRPAVGIRHVDGHPVPAHRAVGAIEGAGPPDRLHSRSIEAPVLAKVVFPGSKQEDLGHPVRIAGFPIEAYHR